MGKKKQADEGKQVTDNEDDNKKTYHNTLLMLEHYRDLVWSMECIPEDLIAFSFSVWGL